MSSHDSRNRWRIGLGSRRNSEESFDYSRSDASTPCGSVSSSPSTPPKKAWERQYRSFLAKRGGSGDNTPEEVHSSPESGSTRSMSQPHLLNNKGGAFSLVPGSKRLLMKRPNKIEKSSLEPLPSIPNLSKVKSNGDMTVKGGNIFSQMFQKDASPSCPSQSRKTKSMDALDLPLRRGVDKAYSPRSNTGSAKVVEIKNGEIPPSPPILSSPSDSHSALKSRNRHSNLPDALTQSAKKHTPNEIRKAFTKFHNSPAFAKDSTSAYLGEDTSTSRGTSYLATYNQLVSHHKDYVFEHKCVPRIRSPPSTGLSKSFEPMPRAHTCNNSKPLLKLVLGPETWKENRRYLITPAILATCPLGVLSALSGPQHITNVDSTPFGTLKLGNATMAYVVGQRSSENTGWSACSLELRQNYLLEYGVDSKAIPRGIAHLQYAKALPHTDFLDALELQFYGSPCVRADHRKLLIRVENTADRDRWISCLNRAAQLTLSDLYDYNSNMKIGSGRYATVYQVRRRDTGEKDSPPNRALKVIDKNEFWRRVVKGMERADTLVREISVQVLLSSKGNRCPSIVKIFGVFETTDVIGMECELLQGRDLFQHLSARSILAEEEAARVLRDVLTCLAAMNRFGVAHRDIKPANILMNDKGDDGVYVKVADFGMSTFVGVDGLLRGRCGTPGYVAPEIFSAGIRGGYGNKVDVFSAGVTLYVMLCGYEPFYGETDAELVDANKNGVLEYPEEDWSTVSQEARELVQAMLEVDSKKRVSASDALKHPWILSKAGEVMPGVRVSSSDSADGAACDIS
mmetsp:Transcript_30813/g.45567  ORF Transcript_30813/g.45567 Transcript_30813/m.45567 type:complete len:797 (+) Transcript_30813:267-2657(+)|eukprot:CAMPEP_0194226060 /NCGR_PEP_ID=MMETSP0156-20130528/40992_1 /TAXON_ID=33649 /ORGANISM="Thalassionema nitzschioides, Strain L26-B" /LENGTH=796 /DNA_ID=CAMNT_0038958261 /DNA_START=149 /DNA_END=2539 /DNA_ORIENTATION=+